MPKHVRFLSCFVLLFLIIAVPNESISQTQTPEPPIECYIEKGEPEINSNTALIYWVTNEKGITPTHYAIYYYNGKTDDLTKFKLHTTVEKHNGSDKQSIHIKDLGTGYYSFFIKSIYKSNNVSYESQPSKILYIDFSQNNDKPYIKIESEYPKYGEIGKEWTYQPKAHSNIRCPIHWELVRAPEGMKIDQTTGKIAWTPSKNGSFDFAIRAWLSCDLNVQAYQQLIVKVGDIHEDEDFIEIISEPKGYAVAGSEYIYIVETKSNPKCAVNMKWEIFYHSPNSNAVERIEGKGSEIKFIPKNPGEYTIFVEAWLSCNEKIRTHQKFILQVFPGNLCSKLSGTVALEDGSLIESGNAYVTMLMSNSDNATFTMIAPIKKGYFGLEIPEGVFVVRFESQGIIPEWYEDANDFSKAKRIEIKCNHGYEIKAVLSKMPEPSYKIASGMVYSSIDKSPIMAKIQFIPLKTNDGRKPNEKDNEAFWTRTDEQGNYKIKLPDSYTYTARAIPEANSFTQQYYNQVYNPWEADLIVLEKDVEGIDFPLVHHKEYQNSFSGKVASDLGSPLKSKVVAYLISQASNAEKDQHYTFSQSSETDVNGYFYFKNLIPGEYVLLSVPADMSYVPGYYVMGDIATLKWREATRVAVGEVMITVVFEIIHRAKSETKGFSEISGFIFDDENKIKSSADDIQKSIGLAGAYVYVANDKGELSGYSFSDESGAFRIDGLETGAYTLFVDRVGYELYSLPVETDYEKNVNVNLNIPMKSEAGSSTVDDEIQSSIQLNPSVATDFILLQFNAVAGNGKISVFNSIGKAVKLQNINTIDGDNSLNLNLSDLPLGFYYIKLNLADGVRTARFIKVK